MTHDQWDLKTGGKKKEKSITHGEPHLLPQLIIHSMATTSNDVQKRSHLSSQTTTVQWMVMDSTLSESDEKASGQDSER